MQAIHDDLEYCRLDLDRAREVAGLVGVSYDTMLNHDLRFYQSLITGFMRRREFTINDNLQVGHIIAEKIAQAVWGDRKFVRKIKSVEIVKPSPVERQIAMKQKLKQLLEGRLV